MQNHKMNSYLLDVTVEQKSILKNEDINMIDLNDTKYMPFVVFEMTDITDFPEIKE